MFVNLFDIRPALSFCVFAIATLPKNKNMETFTENKLNALLNFINLYGNNGWQETECTDQIDDLMSRAADGENVEDEALSLYEDILADIRPDLKDLYFCNYAVEGGERLN